MPHHTVSHLIRRMLLLALSMGLVCLVAHVPKARAADDYLIRLPLVLKDVQADTLPPPAQSMIDRINAYRILAGVPRVQPHPTLMTAAQSHANYDLLNFDDQSAWIYGPHGEVAGKPGFTGQTAGDRMLAAQFPYAPNAEIMNYFDDPVRSVDGWMATVFHRVGVLYPTNDYAGYGHGRSAVEYVDVVDFGRGPMAPSGSPGVVVFPANNQTDVPLYGAGETPSPLPPGAQYPIGYPITLQPIFGAALKVTQAELRDDNGNLISVYRSPAGCANTCYALIPEAGLRPATTYRAHVAGSVDGVAFDTAWSFTTTACAAPGYC